MGRDEELRIIDRIKEGDKEAFRELLEAYEKKVYGFIYRIISEPYISQDLAQETFIKVYKNLHIYDETREFSPWLFSIAKNETFKYLNKRNKVSTIELKENVSIKGTQDQNCIEGLLERKERYREMCRIVNELPKKYSDIIILKYFTGLSYKEISIRLNIPEKKVESRLYLARKAIRKEYKKNNSLGKVIELWNVVKQEI